MRESQDNRRVYFSPGAGSLPYAGREKFIASRLREIASQLESGRFSCSDAERILNDHKGASGNLTAVYLKGFADAEREEKKHRRKA